VADIFKKICSVLLALLPQESLLCAKAKRQLKTPSRKSQKKEFVSDARDNSFLSIEKQNDKGILCECFRVEPQNRITKAPFVRIIGIL